MVKKRKWVPLTGDNKQKRDEGQSPAVGSGSAPIITGGKYYEKGRYL